MENLVQMVVTVILVEHSVRVSLKHLVPRRLIVKDRHSFPAQNITYFPSNQATSVPEVLEICFLLLVT
jgi:hypothetical protein